MTHLTLARWVTVARVPLPTGARKVDLVDIPGQRRLPTARPNWPLSLDFRTNGQRLIALGKFKRKVKDHLSMFLKLRFHVLRCSRNDTFSRAFVNTLSFFGPSLGGSMSETALHTGYWCARVGVWQVRTALLPPPPRPPTPTDRGPRRRGAGPYSYCLWKRFLLQRTCERRKTANFLQMHAKIYHSYSTEGHETRV